MYVVTIETIMCYVELDHQYIFVIMQPELLTELLLWKINQHRLTNHIPSVW